MATKRLIDQERLSPKYPNEYYKVVARLRYPLLREVKAGYIGIQLKSGVYLKICKHLSKNFGSHGIIWLRQTVKIYFILDSTLNDTGLIPLNSIKPIEIQENSFRDRHKYKPT